MSTSRFSPPGNGGAVLVVGGSGSLGQELVQELRRQGRPVAFTSRQPGQEAVQALATSSGATAIAMDVCDAGSVERGCEAAEQAVGPLCGLVYAAAIHDAALTVALAEEDWLRVMDVNLNGAFRLARQVLPAMIGQRYGRLVLVGSAAAGGISGSPAYAAAKAGLRGLSATLSREYGRRGITSNVVEPGLVEGGLGETVAPAVSEMWRTHCPAGRPGRSTEIIAAISFLLSPAASFVNGSILAVNGGLDRVP